MSPFNKTEYDKIYDSQNTMQIKLKLNTKTDKDIINKLRSAQSKQGYIKQLIRADLNKEEKKNG
jgi:hypothetical protein